MAVKTYKYNDTSKLSEHFKVSEFKCKDGKKHEIKIDSNLVTLLERVRTKLNANSCNIYSGYRCVEHDKNVGGSGGGPHTQGYAVDCYFLDKNKKAIPGDIVCCTLEDMGHKYGLAIRCGGSQVNQGKVHIDTKNRKWFGNEAISFSKSISTEKAISNGKTGHTTFLTYCFNPTTYYINANSGLNIRDDNSTSGKVIGLYKFGEAIQVYYILNGWAKVGVNKWVSADYIQKDKPTKIDKIVDEIIESSEIDKLIDETVEEVINDKEIDELITEIIEENDVSKKENLEDIVYKKETKPGFWQRLIEFIKKIFKK